MKHRKKSNLTKGDKEMSVLVKEMNRIGQLSNIINRIQKTKVEIVKQIKKINDIKKCDNKLYGYELLMREYYIRNSQRHLQEVENSLILATEAEDALKKYRD